LGSAPASRVGGASPAGRGRAADRGAAWWVDPWRGAAAAAVFGTSSSAASLSTYASSMSGGGGGHCGSSSPPTPTDGGGPRLRAPLLLPSLSLRQGPSLVTTTFAGGPLSSRSPAGSLRWRASARVPRHVMRTVPPLRTLDLASADPYGKIPLLLAFAAAAYFHGKCYCPVPTADSLMRRMCTTQLLPVLADVEDELWALLHVRNYYSLRSAGLQPSSATVFPSHIAPAPASSHQPGNSIFLSQHSSSSLQLQLQPTERSDCADGITSL